MSRYETSIKGEEDEKGIADCCYLCGQFTDVTGHRNLHHALEHVIPRAAEFDERQVPSSVINSEGNLRTAHFSCNSKKGVANLSDLDLPFAPPVQYDATELAERWTQFDQLVQVRAKLLENRNGTHRRTWEKARRAYYGRDDQRPAWESRIGSDS